MAGKFPSDDGTTSAGRLLPCGNKGRRNRPLLSRRRCRYLGPSSKRDGPLAGQTETTCSGGHRPAELERKINRASDSIFFRTPQSKINSKQPMKTLFILSPL